MKQCPACNGFGKVFAAFHPISAQCIVCEGSGEIDSMRQVWLKQGAELKRQRLERRLTLRGAARAYGIDPSNLSKMERGGLKPRPIYD